MSARSLEGGNHRVRNLRVRQQVSGCGAVRAHRGTDQSQRADTGVDRRRTLRGNGEHLAIGSERRGSERSLEGSIRCAALRQALENDRTQGRVGDVLCGDGAGAGACVRATGRYGR